MNVFVGDNRTPRSSKKALIRGSLHAFVRTYSVFELQWVDKIPHKVYNLFQ
jgi:hypothetical protein